MWTPQSSQTYLTKSFFDLGAPKDGKNQQRRHEPDKQAWSGDGKRQ
jgi:hypothetical protein